MRVMVNGRAREVEVPVTETLLTTLRDRLALTGTKAGCEQGECGSCTVLLDGAPTYSCLVLTHAVGGRSVTTIEGIAPTPYGATLHPVQAAFIAADAVQCGFCTPGQVIAAVALLRRHPDPTDEQVAEAMSGNLCRCGTYPKIAIAVRMAAAALHEAGTADG